MAALLLAAAATLAAEAPEQPASVPATQVAPAQSAAVAPGTVLRGPIDQDEYLVGPGDRFSITLWGQEIMTMTQEVTPEGELVLPGVASLYVAGRSLGAVKDDIRASLSEVYRNVEVTVSLSGLRRMLVNVLGLVESPGIYTGTALDPASELIEKAGGLADGASERNIFITRRDGESRRVDLTLYRNTGDLAANPPILDGDVIFVPAAREFVHVLGAVARPDRYEFVQGETVDELLELAGGFARGAVTDTVEIRTFVDGARTVSHLVSTDDPARTQRRLEDGDQVYVRFLNEWHRLRRVTVEGEAVNPGVYGINEGADRLSDVLSRAGGVTPEGSLRNAMLLRPRERGAVDREYERLSLLSPGNMSETEYAYYKTQSRGRSGVVVADFAKALEGDESSDVLLRDGDRIVIPERSHTVVVSGQVATPGHVEYAPGERYSYYIGEAGGYSDGARRSGVRVIRAATGEWVRGRKAGQVLPGDTVWVPEKQETNWWTTAKDVAQFAASVATAYLLISQATK